MTEAERIEPFEIRIAREADKKYRDSVGFLSMAYIAGATAENERLQQQLKETVKFEEYQTLYSNFAKHDRRLNELLNELKSAQELNRELAKELDGVSTLASEYLNTEDFRRIESLLNKAK